MEHGAAAIGRINELVSFTSIGSKRVALSIFGCTYFLQNECCELALSSSSSSPRKTQLHDLPQDLLIRIVCRVEHDDLKRLMLVSTAMKEAALTAKELHFAFSTPKTRRRPLNFTKAEDLRYSDDESEAPNAPGKSRLGRIRLLTSEKLASITVSLFGSTEEEEEEEEEEEDGADENG